MACEEWGLAWVESYTGPGHGGGEAGRRNFRFRGCGAFALLDAMWR
jgi:hypothetical protein